MLVVPTSGKHKEKMHDIA